MADPKIPGNRWLVFWEQDILSPERGWKCHAMPESMRTVPIPRQLHPGFEWEEEELGSRYRLIAVLDEHSSKFLSILDELENFMGDANFPVFEVMGDIAAAVIKGFEKVGRPY